MIILGVDPGIKHTGVAVLDDGRVVHRETILLSTPGRIPVTRAAEPILRRLRAVVLQYKPTIACVEQVGWYGRNKRIAIPLSHIAGIITGYLVAKRLFVYLLYASQKVGAFKYARRRGEPQWDDHQKDAALLAQVAWQYELAKGTGDIRYLKAHPNIAKNGLG